MALANTRSRLRMTALYQAAAVNGALVAGTGNKIEDFGVGFFTKWGDGGVDLSPIGDLTKTQVYALATFLGVPRSILEAEQRMVCLKENNAPTGYRSTTTLPNLGSSDGSEMLTRHEVLPRILRGK